MSAVDAMETQSLRQQKNRNPRTIEEARALVGHVRVLFMPWIIDGLFSDLPFILTTLAGRRGPA